MHWRSFDDWVFCSENLTSEPGGCDVDSKVIGLRDLHRAYRRRPANKEPSRRDCGRVGEPVMIRPPLIQFILCGTLCRDQVRICRLGGTERMKAVSRIGLVIGLSLTFGMTAFAHYPHDVIEILAQSPTFDEDRTAFVVIRKQLYRTDDGGLNWQRRQRGLCVHRAIAISLSPQYSLDRTAVASCDDPSASSSFPRISRRTGR